MVLLTLGDGRTPCECRVMLPARALRRAVAESGFVQLRTSEFSQ